MKPVLDLNIDFARMVPMETAEGQAAVKEDPAVGDDTEVRSPKLRWSERSTVVCPGR